VKTLDHAETPANHGASENFTGDYVDALQNARRRMGQALRIGKQEEELETL
jgi:hypothetical protein